MPGSGSPGHGDDGAQRASPELPVRDFADMHLAEAIKGGGCPVCTATGRAEAGYLKTLLFEGVTDPVTREELRKAGGFCQAHSRALASTDRESGSMLATAILFEAVVRWRLDALRQIQGTVPRRRRAALERSSKPPDCPVCTMGADAARRARGEILRWSRNDAWANALTGAEFCLDHLLFVWTAAPDHEAWSRIASAQLERIEAIRGLTEQYAYHSSYDRRHLITPQEEAAVSRAAALLGGDPRTKPSRARGGGR